MNSELEILARDVLSGSHRAIARAISLAELGGDPLRQLMKPLFASSGSAHIVGVTGAPGVGKSTLVDSLIKQIRQAGLKVAVLAIDPSSPFTGGAILGDRIRMQSHTLDEGVFIRSMANQGYPGGVSLASHDACRILAAAGFDFVIIETVGVGQSELAVAQTADSTVLVLMPATGDDVQAIKSGIMEIADIFVINKADMPGADKCRAEIVSSLELVRFTNDWRPPVLAVEAQIGKGVAELFEMVKGHQAFLAESGILNERRKFRVKAEITEIIALESKRRFLTLLNNTQQVDTLIASVLALHTDTHSAALMMLNDYLGTDSGIS